MQHTKDKLAEALREVGLHAMAEKAETGYYHDYLSPLALPETQLIEDLFSAADEDEAHRDAILSLRRRAINGDFDASIEESEAWAESEEGQDALRRLMR